MQWDSGLHFAAADRKQRERARLGAWFLHVDRLRSVAITGRHNPGRIYNTALFPVFPIWKKGLLHDQVYMHRSHTDSGLGVGGLFQNKICSYRNAYPLLCQENNCILIIVKLFWYSTNGDFHFILFFLILLLQECYVKPIIHLHLQVISLMNTLSTL